MDIGLIRASQRLSELDIRLRLGAYTVTVYWFRAMMKQGDWFIRRHAHSTYEFHFVAKGECTVEMDEFGFHAGEGCFFLTAPDVYHEQRSAGSPEFIEYSLNCGITRTDSPPGPEDTDMAWMKSVFLRSRCTPIQNGFDAIALFETALHEADKRRQGYELAIRNAVVALLLTVARAMEPLSGGDDHIEEESSRADSRMVRIEQFVLDNINRDLGPSDIASFLNLSEKHVSRIVIANKGFSTKKFITRTKLRRAKELLHTTDRPIKEIARDLGFSSEYYFNSVFKRHEGYPPGLFRVSMKGSGDAKADV
ncbi:MAG: AraC family transcriptional regulator [Rectinema sp.]